VTDKSPLTDEEIRAATVGDLAAHSARLSCRKRTKRDLATKEWTFVQNYADAKSAVVTEILGRARP
jgi:GrpB-like predicted nucleotidyltransferase (UPF0157 family)